MRISKVLICIALSVTLLFASCGGGGVVPDDGPDDINVVVEENTDDINVVAEDNTDDKDAVVESKTEEPKKPEINRKDELPKGDNTFLLQTVESIKEGVYVSGLSGWCGTDGVFVASSDRVFTFWLRSKRNGDFVGWFWVPGSDGQSARRSYDIDSFFGSYYKRAVEMNVFSPIVCSYDFDNYGNTFLELYQVSAVSYSQPDEPDVQEDSALLLDGGKIDLIAENAILSDAPNVILEPDSPPYNLGGWLCGGNVVAWEFEVSNEDEYGIYIYYSRSYAEPDIWGTLTISRAGGSELARYSFRPVLTSRKRNDWSVYKLGGVSTIHLGEGTYRLEMYPERPYKDAHFINLRSVVLVPGDDPAEGDAYIGMDDED